MAVSEHTTTLPVSRRRLLAGAGAAVAATAVAVPVLSASAAHSDAAILSALHRWIAQERHIEAISPTAEDDDFTKECAVADNIMREIAATPTQTITGISIKAYLLAHALHGGKQGNILAVALPERAEGKRTVCDEMQRSLFADATNWLPMIEGVTHA